jgi:hypothetical protein
MNISSKCSDGERIHSILASVKDRSVHSLELEGAIKDWTTYYHLSSQRSVFLRSIRHLFQGRVLEIGAECGALTRFLGETGSDVIAIEPVAERAEAARVRCSDLANVRVVEDLGPGLAGPLDVILTRGTTDWALLRSMLGTSGRLIAIAPAELKEELTAAGFAPYESASLFPDCDAPAVVSTSLDPLAFFDPRTMRHPRPVAPGFLIVASREAPTDRAFPGLLYAYSMNRTPAFAKESVIETHDGEWYIRRRPLVPNAEPPKNPVCRRVLEDERWLTGELYERRLTKIIREDGWRVEQIAAWARAWVDFLRASTLPENYLDCTPFNLIFDASGRLTPFDLEYASVEPLELEYVVFRGLWGSLTRQNECADPERGTPTKVIHLVSEVMRILEMALPESRVAQFVQKEARLQHQVTGAGTRRAAFVLRQQPLSLRNPAKSGQERFICQLYWRGPDSGYQEQESSASLGEFSAERQTIFIPIPALPAETNTLRWDMANRPGQLLVYGLELLDADDDVVWTLQDFPGLSAFRSPFDARVIAARGDLPLSLVLTGEDPSAELVANSSHFRRLAEGGTLLVDCAWVIES